MNIMTHTKIHFNRLMLTLTFGVWAPPRAWPTTEKAGPDRVKTNFVSNKIGLTAWFPKSQF